MGTFNVPEFQLGNKWSFNYRIRSDEINCKIALTKTQTKLQRTFYDINAIHSHWYGHVRNVIELYCSADDASTCSSSFSTILLSNRLLLLWLKILMVDIRTCEHIQCIVDFWSLLSFDDNNNNRWHFFFLDCAKKNEKSLFALFVVSCRDLDNRMPKVFATLNRSYTALFMRIHTNPANACTYYLYIYIQTHTQTTIILILYKYKSDEYRWELTWHVHTGTEGTLSRSSDCLVV